MDQKKSGPIRGRRHEEGVCPSRETGCGGKQPPVERPVVRKACKGELATCQSEEEEPWDGSEIIILFQEVISFP